MLVSVGKLHKNETVPRENYVVTDKELTVLAEKKKAEYENYMGHKEEWEGGNQDKEFQMIGGSEGGVSCAESGAASVKNEKNVASIPIIVAIVVVVMVFFVF